MEGWSASTDTVHNYTIVLQNRTGDESNAVLKALDKKGSEEAATLGVTFPKC